MGVMERGDSLLRRSSPALPWRHDPGVTSALMLVIGLLLADDGSCHFVTNTRILELPTCDIGPATIDELTEDPSASSAASARDRLRRPGPVAHRGRAAARGAAPVLMVRGNEELERRIEREQRERIEAVTERLAAEHARDVALQERDAARRELAAAREALRAARQHRGASQRAGGAGAEAGRPARREPPGPD